MKAKDALIAWTPSWDVDDPTAGKVKVGPMPEFPSDWSKPYSFTGGAAHTDRRSMVGAEAALMVFVDFQTLVIRDGIDPAAAHEAFLAIDEYRERLAPDTPGAD